METNEIRIEDGTMEVVENAARDLGASSHDFGKTVLGAALTVTGILAWEFGVKPLVRKVKAMRAKKKIEDLESFIKLDEKDDEEDSNKNNDEE